MSEQPDSKALAKRRRIRRVVALGAGMLLALVCKSLPPHYHTACDAILSLCSGGAF